MVIFDKFFAETEKSLAFLEKTLEEFHFKIPQERISYGRKMVLPYIEKKTAYRYFKSFQAVIEDSREVFSHLSDEEYYTVKYLIDSVTEASGVSHSKFISFYSKNIEIEAHPGRNFHEFVLATTSITSYGFDEKDLQDLASIVGIPGYPSHSPRTVGKFALFLGPVLKRLKIDIAKKEIELFKKAFGDMMRRRELEENSKRFGI